MFKHIFIAGRPGVGKTTIVKKIVSEINRFKPDWTISGFYTNEIRQEGRRIGFNLHTLNGKKGVLARLSDTTIKSKFRVGKYSVDISDLENIAVPILYRSTDLCVIDELGKMELFSLKFQEAVKYALNYQPRILATIPYYENAFLASIKNQSNISLWELTHANREDLFQEIIKIIIR
ncbi:MAG: NTPase [Candidatus Hodarchaeales archaeon]|jgi:nucleoside-triphosphatase